MKIRFWSVLSGSLALLLLVNGFAASKEQKADEKTPPVMRGFASLSESDLQNGWLLLFDGKTAFGWEAKPLQKKRPLGVPDPKIQIARGEMTITTQIPIALETSLNLNTPWELEIKYHSDSDFVGALTLSDITLQNVRMESPMALSLPASSESTTMAVSSARFQSAQFGPSIQLIIENGKLVIESIRFCPLYVPIFNGEDLTGWNVGGESKAEVARAEEETLSDEAVMGTTNAIHLTGGSGWIESNEDFGDGFLRLEFQEIANPDNSGLFFRTIPGSKMDGYECQMNNNPPEEDRQKFLGNDTGSIFRRAPARRLVTAPGEWTHLTLMANGSSFRTWVNGIPSLLWTDDRPADPNPRKGLRLEAGKIQIQGHDAGTDLKVRNIQMASQNADQQKRLIEQANAWQAAAQEKKKTLEAQEAAPEAEAAENAEIPALDPENAAFEAFRAKLEELKSQGIELTDFHIHLRGGMTPEKALQRAKETGIESGVLENSGREWPLSDSEKLAAFIDEVHKVDAADSEKNLLVGMQVNDRDWFTALDPEVWKRLDFVLADTMIMGTDDEGKPQRLWLLSADYQADPEEWMTRYMAHYLQILDEPITILANPTYLPAFLADRYDELWTEERMDAVIDKAVEKGIALEIQAESPFPKASFIKRALDKGAKISFGTNNFDAVLKNLDRWKEAFDEFHLTNDQILHLSQKTEEN